MKPILKHNRGFKWFESDGVYFKGYFFDEKGRLYKNEEACQFFKYVSYCSVRREIEGLNGSFAVVVNREGIKFAATDRLRSIPLFYTNTEEELFVSDDAETLLEVSRLSIVIDPVSVDEFLLSGFVIGSKTLIKKLLQVRAGEILMQQQDNSHKVIQYYRHLSDIEPIESKDKEFDKLDLITEGWCDRLIRSVDDRQIVIPLSGGYDSRYIAAELVKRNKGNEIISYTYGTVSSPEVIRSKKVAEALGIRWYFVEYSSQKYQSFLCSNKHDEYISFSHQCSSTPHYQEYLALDELTRTGIIKKGAVVIPGFCGDFLGGSYVPLEVKVHKDNLLIAKGIVNHIIAKQLYQKIFLQDKVSSDIKSHIESEIKYIGGSVAPKTVQELVSINDSFFAQHKVAKYVVNSLRVYEFFDLQWRMPLWDNKLHEYWYSIPYCLRGKNCLYNEYLVRRVFIPSGINFTRPPGGGGAKLEKALLSNSCISKHSEKLLLVAHRVNAVFRKEDPTAFDIPKEIYRSQIEENFKKRLPETKTFPAIFSRWILFKLYGLRSSCVAVGKKKIN